MTWGVFSHVWKCCSEGSGRMGIIGNRSPLRMHSQREGWEEKKWFQTLRWIQSQRKFSWGNKPTCLMAIFHVSLRKKKQQLDIHGFGERLEFPNLTSLMISHKSQPTAQTHFPECCQYVCVQVAYDGFNAVIEMANIKTFIRCIHFFCRGHIFWHPREHDSTTSPELRSHLWWDNVEWL